MNLIIIKKKDQPFPNKEFLKLCYNEYSAFMGFAYSFNFKIHINKNYSDFEYFYDDLCKEADENSNVVILFSKDIKNSDHIDNCFPLTISDKQSQKCFLKTENPVIFCENNFNKDNSEILKEFVGFDFEKHSSLFNMISNYQSAVILKKDGSLIELGYWLEHDKLKVSSIVKDDKKENNAKINEKIKLLVEKQNNNQFDVSKSFISHLLLDGIKKETCFYCDNSEKLDVVNNIITLCERCQQRLNVFKCVNCNRLFTGLFYHYSNICSECFYNQPIIKEILFAMHSVSFECSCLNSKNKSMNLVRQLSFPELSDKIFSEDKMLFLFSAEDYENGKTKIFKKLEFPFDKT